MNDLFIIFGGAFLITWFLVLCAEDHVNKRADRMRYYEFENIKVCPGKPYGFAYNATKIQLQNKKD